MTLNENNEYNENNDKWCCPHCKKTYSKTYRYKTHLIRCLVHTENANTYNDMSSDMLLELKHELKTNLSNDIRNMIIELKHEIQNIIKQPYQPYENIKKLHTVF